MSGKKKKAIVIAGSRGIGKAISNELIKLSYQTVSTSKKDLDTSDLKQVEKFIKNHKSADILVLNTGGPPAKDFKKITKHEWIHYFNQLFLSLVLMLQKIKIKNNGYVFLISSFYIKEPAQNMMLSNSFRVALTSILKTYSKDNFKKNITTVNFALGPFYTDRLKELNPGKTKKQIGKNLPLGRTGETKEIADLVHTIISNEIKYLNGQTIFLDGGISNTIF